MSKLIHPYDIAMKKIISILLSLLILNPVYTQCDQSYQGLCSQERVDILGSYDCEELDTVRFTIWCNPDSSVNDLDIDDLSPLSTLKRINYLSTTTTLRNLESLNGFGNLNYIGHFIHSFSGLDFDNSALKESLDTIIKLWHFTQYNHNLSVYQNVNRIDSIWVSGDCSLGGLNESARNSIDFLYIQNNSDINYSSDFIANYKDTLDFLRISNCDGLIIDSLYQIDHIKDLALTIGNAHGIGKLYNVNADKLQYFGWKDAPIESFPNLDTLESLRIGSFIEVRELSQILPNLKKINGSLEIRNNNHLSSLSFLNDFDAPLYDVWYQPTTGQEHLRELVVIADNPKLDSCNIDYLCKTLELFPDSVRIENNGIACTLDEVKKYCGLTSVNDSRNKEFRVFPNPANTELSWEADRRIEHYQIFTALGEKVKSKKVTKQRSIDISHLMNGLYFIRFSNQDQQWTTSFIKN